MSTLYIKGNATYTFHLMIPHYFAGLPLGASVESHVRGGLILCHRANRVVDSGSVSQLSQ